jgi:hypothetical protein
MLLNSDDSERDEQAPAITMHAENQTKKAILSIYKIIKVESCISCPMDRIDSLLSSRLMFCLFRVVLYNFCQIGSHATHVLLTTISTILVNNIYV